MLQTTQQGRVREDGPSKDGGALRQAVQGPASRTAAGGGRAPCGAAAPGGHHHPQHPQVNTS